MPGIFKRFANVSANKYVFPDAEDLAVSVEAPAPVEPAGPEASPVEEAADPKPEPEQQ